MEGAADTLANGGIQPTPVTSAPQTGGLAPASPFVEPAKSQQGPTLVLSPLPAQHVPPVSAYRQPTLTSSTAIAGTSAINGEVNGESTCSLTTSVKTRPAVTWNQGRYTAQRDRDRDDSPPLDTNLETAPLLAPESHEYPLPNTQSYPPPRFKSQSRQTQTGPNDERREYKYGGYDNRGPPAPSTSRRHYTMQPAPLPLPEDRRYRHGDGDDAYPRSDAENLGGDGYASRRRSNNRREDRSSTNGGIANALLLWLGIGQWYSGACVFACFTFFAGGSTIVVLSWTLKDVNFEIQIATTAAGVVFLMISLLWPCTFVWNECSRSCNLTFAPLLFYMWLVSLLYAGVVGALVITVNEHFNCIQYCKGCPHSCTNCTSPRGVLDELTTGQLTDEECHYMKMPLYILVGLVAIGVLFVMIGGACCSMNQLRRPNYHPDYRRTHN